MDNGFYDALYDGLGGLLGRISGVVESGTRTGASAAEAVIDTTGKVIGNASEALSKTTSVLKWAIPVLIIVILIGVSMYFKKPSWDEQEILDILSLP